MLHKIGILKNSQEKICVLFLNKVTGMQSESLFKTDSITGAFTFTLSLQVKFPRMSFKQNTSGYMTLDFDGLILNFHA